MLPKQEWEQLEFLFGLNNEQKYEIEKAQTKTLTKKKKLPKKQKKDATPPKEEPPLQNVAPIPSNENPPPLEETSRSHIKNMTKTKKQLRFNFGIRKPVLNCKELLSEYPWNPHLLNKWIYTYDLSEQKDIFFKHIFVDKRVLQIIYSGIDILGDGVYILYKANIHLEEDNFSIEPDEYSLLFGSFECENYLERLVEEGYITEAEKEMFENPIKIEKAKTFLHKVKC